MVFIYIVKDSFEIPLLDLGLSFNTVRNHSFKYSLFFYYKSSL